MDHLTVKDGFLGQKMIVLPSIIKKELNSNQITQPFYITDIGYYPNAHNHYRSRKKGAKEYIFIYCVSGHGMLKIKDDKHEIGPNHFFIIPKDAPHSYWADFEDPWSIYWMHFDGAIAQNLFDRYRRNYPEKGSISFENDRIILFEQVFQIFESDYVAPRLEYASVLGLNFISSFIFHDIDETVSLHHRTNLIDSIIDFLNKNIDKSLKSEDIAKEFKYSSSYLFNLFKKRTGYSLIHFFNLKKIQKACEYLNYTDLSIKEISFKVGYQDPLYFSRMFKKYMGVSPKFYKKEMNN